jgi:hypothetical protein
MSPAGALQEPREPLVSLLRRSPSSELLQVSPLQESSGALQRPWV